jgi:hypothetical protein
VPLAKVKEFEQLFLLKMKQLQPEVMKNFASGKWNKEDQEITAQVAQDVAKQFA